jgi:hypothetical protein
MKITLLAFATLIVGNVALAIPVPPHPVVSPSEKMVTVPGLEYLGASRISSVRFCVQQTGAKDWHNLITDSELESMHDCLQSLT